MCDETTTDQRFFACGDGELRLASFTYPQPCYNYRNMMFFCEFPSNVDYMQIASLWTLENGHCVDKGQIEKNLTDMDESEQCRFYLKCIITDSKITGCDDVIRLFDSTCKNKIITYPSEPVFKPYLQTIYNLTELDFYKEPTSILFNGSIKCPGYQARSDSQEIDFDWNWVSFPADFDHFFCNNSEKKLESGPQIDKNCWNDTKQSFLCQKIFKCISKHRLKDGMNDCDTGVDFESEDESDSQRCYKKNKHRLNCSGNPSICVPVSRIGDNANACNTTDDEVIKELKWVLADRKCITPNSIECNVLKTYIQSNSSVLLPDNSKIISFREYCDTVWHLPRGFDESLCKEWKCPKDQYQCLTGHCTPTIYGFYQFNYDWNCPDASDDIGLLRITQLSEHNSKIISHSLLEKIKSDLTDYNNDSDIVSFPGICNANKEYACILANVTDPLNFTINRPCINLTQIGDGIIDCYGGLDERNLLTCGNNIYEQRGFDFHCSDQQCIPFHNICIERCSNDADTLLCDQLPSLRHPSYSFLTAITKICEYKDFYTNTRVETKYYCDFTRIGK
jgi:hypothetical protein